MSKGKIQIVGDMEKAYKEYTCGRPCLVVGCKTKSTTHHLRGRYLGGGLALKPSDLSCIPLCYVHHDELHRRGNDTFEREHGLDLVRELVWNLQGFILSLGKKPKYLAEGIDYEAMVGG